MSKRIFSVTIPIAGHAIVEVEAETEEEAIEAAFDKVQLSDIDSWEALHRFSEGNVLYCPSPWHAEAEDVGEAS